ncbi:MAG: hypothetical protein KGH61_01610 [Candidatus Micrarchaeota archaeon]|nr:hypothetical protein [Candidatus Micrarchaeota archaeon]MDE1847627.1 hypothetical protein [Candidatus Micrarchaeota archaeon]MDE1863830.1 hypothetical protein [Candidatus Micrarchaeota archaeon]
MKQSSFVERVIYRLIRKHISGPTMGSALARAKQLNSKGIPVSINFMSRPPQDRAKANYITTTYMQLVREIARLGVKASVHLQLQQLGSNLSDELAVENLQSVIDASRKCGVFVWCEVLDPAKDTTLVSRLSDPKGLGFAFSSVVHGMNYAKRHRPIKELKVMCKPEEQDVAEKVEGKAKKPDSLESIEAIAQASRNLVLLSPKESIVEKLVKKNGKYRKSLIFEFQLGYGEKKLNKMLKKGTRISIYIPFGKDWASYAMNNVPEGYMRMLANSLLTGQKEDKSV